MVEIQSKEVIDKMSEDLKIQPALALPRMLGNAIIPVFDAGPRKACNIIKNSTVSDAVLGTLYTTPSDKDFYLNSVSLSVTKDAGNTSIASYIELTDVFGNVTKCIVLRYEPSTAGSHHDSICFPMPIKLKKGTTISIKNTASTASIDTNATITGFTVDLQ